MIKNPLLFFSMQLDDTPNLNHGRLFLMDPERKGIVGRWIATSGVGQDQGIGEWSKQRGGVIPPNYHLQGVPIYQVSTNPIWQSLDGINTNTYLIEPVTVTTTDGVKRSELLIHKSRHSNPVSASLGCIVLPQAEFTSFEAAYKEECSHLTQVPLLVGYTYDV
jgi:hypothetical protein